MQARAFFVYNSSMYSLLLALIYIAFISLGLPDSLLGSGWPVMHEEMGVSVDSMGIITMVVAGCTIISSLFSNFLTRKVGTRVITVVSVFLTAGALLAFSFATKFWMLIVFAVPYGLGAGAIDASLNNYVALHYKSRHMSWLHCFWGVGTIVSPFVMSYALSTSSWSTGYRIVGFVQLGIGVLLLVTLPVWKKVGKSEEEVAQSQKKLGIIGAVRIRGVPFLLLAFFSYCALEATAMSWSSTYFTEVKGIGAEQAAQFASLFYIGITAGRFISGFVSDRLGDKKMIFIGAGVLALGIILLFIPTEEIAVSIAGFVMIGLGCAPIYPCIIHATPAAFGAENSSAIIGIQMASAYVGSTFMPPLFGLLGGKLGFSIMPVYLIIFFVLMVVMAALMFSEAAKGRRAEG